jgi:SWI/SNF-related matrix-associated actin-dependent regulator of chromatin subfamily A3
MRRYRHAVTDVRSSTRFSETGGGILADEMGMGKSLSTLSLIAKTFDDGQLWAQEELSQASDFNVVKKRAPVTLIIAPSASEPKSRHQTQICYELTSLKWS